MGTAVNTAVAPHFALLEPSLGKLKSLQESLNFVTIFVTPADSVSVVVRRYCPVAAANMSANPDSICRIGYEKTNVWLFMTTLGMYDVIVILVYCFSN